MKATLNEAGDLREQVRPILEAALTAVDPRQAVLTHVHLEADVLHIGPRSYRMKELGRIIVVGTGKAGAPMAAAMAEVLDGHIATGSSVNVKYGHTGAAGGWKVSFGCGAMPPSVTQPAVTGPIALVEAAHPVPDRAGQAGAERIVTALTGLTPRDLVIVLISGGGSALMPLPAPGVTLADLQRLTEVLLRCGADITELNAARKHCSQIQGGQLARRAAPAQVASLILSDVVGSPLDTIASGPTVPDRSTYTDVLAMFERYGVTRQIPAGILEHVRRGQAGAVPDTPKAGDPLFDRVNNVIIGDNASAARAAVAEARHRGWHAHLLTTYLQGEAREVGKAIAGLAQGVAWGASDFVRPACLVLGGETTVTIRGDGKGGRNQELALAAGIALAGQPLPEDVGVMVVSLGTDGTDGPTDAAGGIGTPATVARGRALGLDAHAALASNDSYPYLAALDDLLITGPTNTNVNDLVLVFVD